MFAQKIKQYHFRQFIKYHSDVSMVQNALTCSYF